MPVAEIKPGQELPPLERNVTMATLVAYGAASWDWHRYHYDQALAQSLGLQGPFVDGQMFGGLFAKQVLDWAGPNAWLRKLSLRYRTLVFPPAQLIFRGQVSGVQEQDGRQTVDCELFIEAGENGPVVATASATVEF